MPEIFISYSHIDSVYAHKLDREFKNRGFDVFIDNRVEDGTIWTHVLQENLDASVVLVLIMSSTAFKSNMVQNELTRALRMKKKIFPLLLEGEPWLLVEATQFTTVKGGQIPPDHFFNSIRKALSLVQNPPQQKGETGRFTEFEHLMKGSETGKPTEYEQWIVDTMMDELGWVEWNDVKKQQALSLKDLEGWFYRIPKNQKEKAVAGAIAAMAHSDESSELKVFQAIVAKEGEFIDERKVIIIDASIDPDIEFDYAEPTTDPDTDEDIDQNLNIYDINDFS